MRRALRALVLACAVAAVASGCFIFQEDPPNRSCEGHGDCFQAQGERCIDGTCEVPADAAPEPDAPPTPDADTTDAPPAIDAGPMTDADTTDAAR